MKNIDTSAILYEKYFSLTNREIKITLKSGKIIDGEIVGFTYKDTSNKQIAFWHFQPMHSNYFIDFDNSRQTTDIIIPHKEIVSVYFYEDNSICYFTNE